MSVIDFSRSFRMAMAHNNVSAAKVVSSGKLGTKQAISKITTGDYNISMDAAESYAEYFNVDFMTFLNWGLDMSKEGEE